MNVVADNSMAAIDSGHFTAHNYITIASYAGDHRYPPLHNCIEIGSKSITESMEAITLTSLRISTTSVLLSKMFDIANEELVRYFSFREKWDGYEAVRFEASTIFKAMAILSAIRDRLQSISVLPLEITPGPASDGSVDIEVRYGGRMLILTVEPSSDSIGYYFCDPDNMQKEESSIEWSSLEPALLRFIV